MAQENWLKMLENSPDLCNILGKKIAFFSDYSLIGDFLPYFHSSPIINKIFFLGMMLLLA